MRRVGGAGVAAAATGALYAPHGMRFGAVFAAVG